MKKKKVLLVFFGIIVVLILLEFSLHLGSFICSYFFIPRYDFSDINSDENTKIVFCLGDSFTYGIGAGFNHSYPLQMEKILNENSDKFKFKIYNLGVPGDNSTQIASKLKYNYARLKPDVIVLLIGCNDTWNFEKVSWQWDWSILLIKSLLSRLKIYKLGTILLDNIRTNKIAGRFQDNNVAQRICSMENDTRKLIRYGNTFRKFGYFEQAKLYYQKVLRIDKENELALLEMGRCCKLGGEYSKAIEFFTAILRKNTANKQIYSEFEDAFIRWDNVDEQIKFFSRLLEEFPNNKLILRQLSKAYAHLGGLLFLDGQPKMAREVYFKAVELDLQNEKARLGLNMADSICRQQQKRFFLSLSRQKPGNNLKKLLRGYLFIKILPTDSVVDDILFKNLVAISRTCQKQNIQLVFSGYPYPSSTSVSYKLMEQVSFLQGISLVDHGPVFSRLLAEEEFNKYFVSENDFHCTKEGYRVMAENIAEKILEFYRRKDN